MTFSAQTNSRRVQEQIEANLEKKKRTLLGAPVNRRVVIFVDDVNMPAVETYGASPPVELLRQFQVWWFFRLALALASSCVLADMF